MCIVFHRKWNQFNKLTSILVRTNCIRLIFGHNQFHFFVDSKQCEEKKLFLHFSFFPLKTLAIFSFVAVTEHPLTFDTTSKCRKCRRTMTGADAICSCAKRQRDILSLYFLFLIFVAFNGQRASTERQQKVHLNSFTKSNCFVFAAVLLFDLLLEKWIQPTFIGI